MRPGRGPSLPLLLAVAAAVVLALAHAAELRSRAEAALATGMPPREAQLARGFVLGEDEDVDPQTVEDFRRAGLSHLLAVSGQNVALLALLAMPVLAALGIPLPARLVWVLGLIAVYVPLAGAGPSIQRAGVMGALSVFATLAGRRASRLYALAFAAVAMLALEPGVAADVGWQLSFAAVLGIVLLARPLREAIAARIGGGGWRRALADGAAMTVAATLATAPLIAFHFGEVSTVTLVSNLLALPAVAPAMWLGMLSAAAGQLPGFPVAALNALEAPLLAYIAQVAAWCGRPGWACLHVRLGLGGLVLSYLGIAGGAIGALRFARHRRIAATRRQLPADGTESGHIVRFESRRRGFLSHEESAHDLRELPWLAIDLLPRAAGDAPASKLQPLFSASVALKGRIRVVIATAVGFDDQAGIGPKEVWSQATVAHLHETVDFRWRQARSLTHAEELPLHLATRSPGLGMDLVEQHPQPSNPASASAPLNQLPNRPLIEQTKNLGLR